MILEEVFYSELLFSRWEDETDVLLEEATSKSIYINLLIGPLYVLLLDWTFYSLEYISTWHKEMFAFFSSEALLSCDF